MCEFASSGKQISSVSGCNATRGVVDCFCCTLTTQKLLEAQTESVTSNSELGSNKISSSLNGDNPPTRLPAIDLITNITPLLESWMMVRKNKTNLKYL